MLYNRHPKNTVFGDVSCVVVGNSHIMHGRSRSERGVEPYMFIVITLPQTGEGGTLHTYQEP